MVNQAAIYRQLKERFGSERARRISSFAGALTIVIGESLFNNFERHDVMPAFAAVYGAMLYDTQESLALNQEEGGRPDGRYQDLTNLDELKEILALTCAPDPEPPPMQPSLAELMAGFGYPEQPPDPINDEAARLAEESGASFSEEGNA